MDAFTCEELKTIYLTEEGLASLCDMLALVPQEDWPRDEVDLEWLFWSFEAERISGER